MKLTSLVAILATCSNYNMKTFIYKATYFKVTKNGHRYKLSMQIIVI